MDPQRYIRDLSVRKTPKGIMRTLLVVSGDIPLHDDVVGFCEYGVAVETTDEHEGVYQISYIATALKVRGTHLGDTLLSSVIVRLRDDAWRFNRTPLVLTQVDPRNKPSMDLFTRF
ncbi:GNAT family N-acetyltransferase, partial [Bifidobacterium longum]